LVGFKGTNCELAISSPTDITLKTSDIPFAATNGTIFARLKGKSGTSQLLSLVKSSQQGKIDKVHFDITEDIGDLEEVYLEIDSVDGWHGESIEVSINSKPPYKLPINSWLKLGATPNITLEVDPCDYFNCPEGTVCVSTPFLTCNCSYGFIWNGDYCEDDPNNPYVPPNTTTTTTTTAMPTATATATVYITPSPVTSDTQSSANDETNSTTQLGSATILLAVEIVLAVLIFLALIVVIVFFAIRTSNQKKKKQVEESIHSPTPEHQLTFLAELLGRTSMSSKPDNHLTSQQPRIDSTTSVI